MLIKDICSSLTDGSHNPPQGISESSFLMLSSKNVFDDNITLDEPRFLSKEDFENENKRTNIKTGDILLTIVGTVGRSAVVTADLPPFTLQRSVAVLHPNIEVCNERYLMYALQGRRSYIENRAKGVAQKGIYLKEVAGIDIPVPSKDVQNKIVAKLDKVNSIIKYRRTELLKLDELVKARFIELFGDPVLNPYNWDVVTIGDIVTDVRYGTSKPAVEGGKYPYLRMNNLTYDGHLDLSDMKYIDIPDNEIEKCIVRMGDVLFNRTNSIELVGKTCVFDLDEEMVIAGYIIRVRLNEKLLPIVLSSYMNSAVLKEQLRNMAKGAVNQANINAQELQSIKIYLPPIELQNQFATFVEQTDKSKLEIRQSLEKLETLKKSLMQKYFG